MDNLNNIPNIGNWGDAASKLNDNFNKVKQAVTTVENASKNNKGYFSSLSALNTAFPSPKPGQTAYVYDNATSNYIIYNAVNGLWTTQSVTAPPIGVAVNDYAKHGGSSKTLKQVDDEIVQLAGDIEIKELIGQSVEKYDITASHLYVFIPDKPVGVSGRITQIDFAQTINRVATSKIVVAEKMGGVMKIIRVDPLPTVANMQYVDVEHLNIYIQENQYFGMLSINIEPLFYLYKLKVGGVKAYAFTNEDAVVGAEASVLTPNPIEFDYSITIKSNDSIATWVKSLDMRIKEPIFKGKVIDTYGDSITWYDGEQYTTSHLEYPKIAVGYQSYMREILKANVLNHGYSGFTLPQIREQLISKNFATTPFCTITGGVNDWGKDVSIGAIMPIGSAFDTTTSYGALQSMIEHILGQNKACRIYLITPIRGWVDSMGSFPEVYADMFKGVGKLYGIPVCDWYNGLSFNELTNSHYYKDTATLADRKIHPGDAGFKRMGEYLCSFMLATI